MSAHVDRTRLDGAVALISGAARGQGECEARLLVERGARVVLTDVLDELGHPALLERGLALLTRFSEA